MSIRLKARLSGQMSSDVEQSYLHGEDITVLENQMVDMTVNMQGAYIEHESPGHDYLPCMHLVGRITELRGDFPYNVSALYFGAEDDVRLTKDFYYYPTPDEMARLIQVGRYYTPGFKLPEVLSENVYTFPVIVNLTVVPPRNLAAYEMNEGIPFEDLADEDKLNLPTFYVGIVGSGVTRRNDRLLDYYGLDLEEQFDQFVFTAESSGYTNPTLFEYITEPVIEVEEQKESVAEHYITPEEERQMLVSERERLEREEAEAQAQMDVSAQADFREPTPEDAMLAQADRDVIKRIENRLGSSKMSLDVTRRNAAERHQMQAAAEAEAEAKRKAAEAEIEEQEGVSMDDVLTPEGFNGAEAAAEPSAPSAEPAASPAPEEAPKASQDEASAEDTGEAQPEESTAQEGTLKHGREVPEDMEEMAERYAGEEHGEDLSDENDYHG